MSIAIEPGGFWMRGDFVSLSHTLALSLSVFVCGSFDVWEVRCVPVNSFDKKKKKNKIKKKSRGICGFVSRQSAFLTVCDQTQHK